MSGHVVLLGLMGSGKSTVGPLVASALGRRYVDNDEGLEALTGREAKAIEDAEGRAELHRLERLVLSRALAASPSAVLGAAASVVEDADARAGLSAAPLVVWLDAPVDVLVTRVRAAHDAGDDHRPLPSDLEAHVAALATRRNPLFASVATLVVDAQLSPAAAAAQIVAALG